MAKYERGIRTKSKILAACKKLFYEKGYEETTFDDICLEGKVNRGLIHYHFQGKYNIGRQIFSCFLVDTRNLVDKILLKQSSDEMMRYIPAVHMRTYLNLLLGDENLKKFYYQMSNVTQFTANHADIAEIYHRKYLEAFGLEFSDIDIKFLTAAVMGIGSSINLMYMYGYLDVSVEEYVDYRVRMFYSLLNVDRKMIEDITEESRRIYSGVHIGTKKYFTPYIKRRVAAGRRSK